MSEPDSPEKAVSEATSKGFPFWKKVLLTISSTFLFSGLAMMAFDSINASGTDPQSRNLSDGKANGQQTSLNTSGIKPNSLNGETSLVPPQSNPEGRYPEGAEHSNTSNETFQEWSPALVKGGLSFFVGFCLGCLLRVFFKISAVIIALVLLSIFGLSYAGIIDMDWTVLEGHYETVAAKIGQEFSQFKTFITGTLPSAGLASLGVFTGVKRK